MNFVSCKYVVYLDHVWFQKGLQEEKQIMSSRIKCLNYFKNFLFVPETETNNVSIYLITWSEKTKFYNFNYPGLQLRLEECVIKLKLPINCAHIISIERP